MSDHKHHSPEDSYFEDTDTNDSAEPLSKTELKRQSAQMQKLGEELVKLTPAHLATIPMDEELEEAVMLGRAINRKKDGYRRQLQFICKLLRTQSTYLYKLLETADPDSVARCVSALSPAISI